MRQSKFKVSDCLNNIVDAPCINILKSSGSCKLLIDVPSDNQSFTTALLVETRESNP